MPGRRQRGMDHDIYPFSPLPLRPPFRLPERARVAFFIVLHVEYRELLPPPEAYRDPRFRGEFGDFSPEYRTWTYREYGNRVGIFRVLDMIGRFRLPVTAAIGATVAGRYPTLIATLREYGCEPVAHGRSAAQMLTSRMSEAEERDHIAQARADLARVWGSVPSGWLGQDFGATARTSRLLAELGFSYTLDWPNDEQPYWHNPDRSLVAVPAQAEWDDVQTLWLRRVPPQRFPRLVGDALTCLLDEPQGARVLGIGLHPWMIGAPHRIRYLGEALAQVAGRAGVLPATAGQIAAWFREGQQT